MKKISFKQLLDNNRFLQLFSLVVAILCWLMVAMTQSLVTNHTVREIPVDIDMQAQSLVDLGLTVIEGAENQVDVTLRGPRTTVGQLKAEDLKVTASIAGVSEPMTYDLSLTLANAAELAAMDVEVENFSPSTVRVRFDRIATKTFNIESVVSGLSTSDQYVSDLQRVTPSRVTVSGPQADLDRIERAVVSAELTESLERNYVAELPIQLLDAQGEAVDLEDGYLNLDSREAQLMIRVLKLKVLPLVVELTSTPQGFPREDLDLLMEMSDDAIELAGPVDIMDNYQEISLGYIDLKELTIDNNLYVFDVELPSDQFVNINNIVSVVVEFDTENWDTARFNSSEIRVVNTPLAYDVNVLSSQLNNITLVGKVNVIQAITAEDIVVTVDLSDKEVEPGQYNYPVKISVPTKGMAWAVGDYSVIIQVTERASD